MARVEQMVRVPPDRVYAVLADGWSYSDWVVGTAHIRDVDDTWPEPGSRIHHTVGLWPMWLTDHTEMLENEPGRRLVMQPHLWPLGEVKVTITLTPTADGGTRISMEESFEKGPMWWLQTRANDVLLHWRNRESLRRLSTLAVRRNRAPQ